MSDRAAPTSRLSSREREIAELVATGKSNRAIADSLYLSERTVERHVSAVFNKLDVHSRAELIAAVFGGALQTDAPSAPDAARLESAAQSSAAKTNLPFPRTNLIGRETEIADVVRILRDNRLLTVTGAGGVGKTRTAVAVGDALVEGTRAGVWFVELAPLAHGSLIGSAVARVLNVQESLNHPLLETLLAYLKQKSLLLILDNCEHVISEAAALADELLRGCPNLRILATSREPLRIAGEQIYRLPSLSVPSPQASSRLTATEAADYAAIRLFIQHAKAVDNGFKLSDDNAPIIAQICRRLDGIPLAIELAAARVNVLSVAALSTKLDQRFRILTSGSRTVLPRHQTMRALIDWSYDLLCEPERAVLRRLGIFAGGWTPEAAETVCAGGGIDPLGVLDTLWSLVDKSLVVVDLSGERTRYRLLKSTREYVLEKLVESGEDQSGAYRRHAQWLAAYGEHAVRAFSSQPNLIWLDEFWPEIDNVRSALEWTLHSGFDDDVLLAGQIAGSFRGLWLIPGRFRECR